MKIVLTGSLGNVSRPLAETLITQGHSVTVISSNANKQNDIVALGATAAIGRLQDVDFLTTAFTGADAVYCMVPPNYAEPDQLAYYRGVGQVYVQAIQRAGVKRVVDLSSYGAHLERGTGLIVGCYHIEQMLNALSGIAVTHMRPGFFYYNLYAFIPMIKQAGFLAANYGGSDRLVMVSPMDIATAVAEELVRVAVGVTIRYVASDERSASDVARILGDAIGKPALEWKTITNEEMLNRAVSRGMSPTFAAAYVELSGAIHTGALTEDYDLNKPVPGKVKIEAFARDFAAAFNRN